MHYLLYIMKLVVFCLFYFYSIYSSNVNVCKEMSYYMKCICVFAVDIWSVGCIMGEMVKGGVIFQGTDRILSCSVYQHITCNPIGYMSNVTGLNR